MNAFKKALAPVALFCLLTIKTHAQAVADDSQSFAFKFQTNQPLTYAVSYKFRTVTDNNIGGKESLTSSTKEIRYRARLTVYKANPDGTTLVYFKPYSFAEDLDSVGPSHLISHIRDVNIKSEQNGIVTIDTANNVGMGPANPIKLSVYPNLLSGYFDFDPAGRILKFEGDIPFIDYWNNVLKDRIGFFDIYFPDHPVGLHEAWTENISLYSGGGAFLDNPLIITNTFTRGLDLVANGSPISTFDVTSSDHLQNISGHIEQNGQKTSLNFSQFDHNLFGTFHFDQKRGVLLDANKTDTADVTINILVQGNSATSHVNNKSEMQIKLITEPNEPVQK